MLGLLHKVVLGKAPPQFAELIRPQSTQPFPRGLRAPPQRHTRPLHDPIDGTQAGMMDRSLLGLVYTYNMLPQHVVDAVTVKCV